MEDIGPQLDSDPLNPCVEDHNDCSEVEVAEDEPELPQSSSKANVDNNEEDEEIAVHRDYAHVPDRFFEDPLMGMGLSEAVVRSRYHHQQDEPGHKKVTLEQRMRMAVEKMKSAKTTTAPYVRITNIFLVSKRVTPFPFTLAFLVVAE